MFSTWAAVLTYTTPAPNTAVFTGPYRCDGDIDNMSAIQVSEDLEVCNFFCELLDSLSYKKKCDVFFDEIKYPIPMNLKEFTHPNTMGCYQTTPNIK